MPCPFLISIVMMASVAHAKSATCHTVIKKCCPFYKMMASLTEIKCAFIADPSLRTMLTKEFLDLKKEWTHTMHRYKKQEQKRIAQTRQSIQAINHMIHDLHQCFKK